MDVKGGPNMGEGFWYRLEPIGKWVWSFTSGHGINRGPRKTFYGSEERVIRKADRIILKAKRIYEDKKNNTIERRI